MSALSNVVSLRGSNYFSKQGGMLKVNQLNNPIGKNWSGYSKNSQSVGLSMAGWTAPHSGIEHPKSGKVVPLKIDPSCLSTDGLSTNGLSSNGLRCRVFSIPSADSVQLITTILAHRIRNVIWFNLKDCCLSSMCHCPFS